MQSLCTFPMLLLSAPPLSVLPLNISLHILSSPPLHLFSKNHLSASLCAPPLKPLTLTLSAPPVWTLSLNGWEDIYKGRYRLKNRECSMGNSSNQSLSGLLLHHSVYLLSTFFLWTCRTISLPFLLHWHTCSALRGTKRTKSTFAYGVWGCHNHVTFSRMIILNPAESLKPFAFVLVSHTASLDTGHRLTSALREPMRTKCTLCISISTTHAYLTFRCNLLTLSLYTHFFSHSAVVKVKTISLTLHVTH